MHKLLSATLFAAFTLASASAAYAQVPGGPPRTTVPDPKPTTTYSCTDELGHLRRVHVEELAPVQDPGNVWVTPICVDDTVFRTAGNAGALRTAIASNRAMEAALEDKAFGPDDVVGVRMTALDKVILYVNPNRH